MTSKFVFIYDGECPFCNHFAELLELKSGLTGLSILNGRDNLLEIKNLFDKGYDLDNGAILIKDDEILHGAKAINFICTQIKNPSNSLLQILSLTFSSARRTNFIFPFLLIARRLSLAFKGVSSKLLPD